MCKGYRDLQFMCDEFGFEFYEMGGMYVIKSKNDTWGIKCEHIENNARQFPLYHMGTCGTTAWHKQSKNKMDLYGSFKYMAAHDKKLFRPGAISYR